jgi:ABC-type sugar transport system substrate-binding protein
MKQWTRLAALLATAVMVVSCAGCGKTGTTAYEKKTTASQTDTDTAGLKIAYSSVAGETEAPWVGALWNAMEEVCEENSWTFCGLSASGVPATQEKQIDQLLAEDPDYFVIFAGDVTMADEWVEKVHNAGVPVIMACIDATGAVTDSVSAFVGPDQEALAAQLAADLIGINGDSAGLNVVSISGFACQQDYILRQQGYEKTLTYFSNYTLLANDYAGASRDSAKEIMENYLSTYGDTIDAVMCYDDTFALGALDALEEANLDKDIQVYSITGSNDILEAVSDGRIAETAMVSPSEIAEDCGKVISGLEQGIIPDHYNYTTRTYITADNVKDYVGKSEF